MIRRSPVEIKSKKAKYILVELGHHLPYSILGVIAAIIMMAILTFVAKVTHGEKFVPEASREIFHVFHPAHVLFSAVATTAMFWKHDNQNIYKAMGIGLIGSVTICGISDIFIPYLGGLVLGQKMSMHLCLIKEPQLIFPFAVVGILAGFLIAKEIEKSTEYSHSIHVFLSSSASLLYLIGFGLVDWIHAVTGVFFVTIIAVMIPCCLSDIVFPMVCTHKYCQHN